MGYVQSKLHYHRIHAILKQSVIVWSWPGGQLWTIQWSITQWNFNYRKNFKDSQHNQGTKSEFEPEFKYNLQTARKTLPSEVPRFVQRIIQV